jgi:hypothetical protein
MKGEIGCVVDASTVTTEVVSPIVVPASIPNITQLAIIKRKYIVQLFSLLPSPVK